MLVLTREDILALMDSAGDNQSLRRDCESALWHVDGNGELRGWHTDAGDRVRAAVAARSEMARNCVRPQCTPFVHAHVTVTTITHTGFHWREPQVWISYVRCVASLDPFQSGAHTHYDASDVASEITRWRSQNGVI